MLYVLGMLGVLMAMAGIPVAPAVVGLILGPLFEVQMLRAVLLEGGSVSGLFAGPLSITLWVHRRRSAWSSRCVVGACAVGRPADVPSRDDRQPLTGPGARRPR